MKETPLYLEGIHDNIYAGFGPRLASLLLDALVMFPLGFIVLYLNSSDKDMYFYTFLPNFIIMLWYHIYLPKKYGGTPGKLIMGIRIIKLDGYEIDWKEAILRHSVIAALTVFNIILMTNSILKADDAIFNSLSWTEQTQYLMSLSPLLFTVYIWFSNIWTWGELIVLLTNPRKRALHDYIAGTVIVKKIYIKKIQQQMYPEKETSEF